MKGKMRKSIVILIGVFLVAMVSGCSTLSLLMQGEFDASGYVKGILDSSYKGQFEEYIKLTDDSQENAQSAYDKIMETKAEGFATYTAVTLTDELKPKFIDYSKQIYKQAKYEVAEAKKTDKGFTVDITITPMTILQAIETEGEAFVNDFNAKNQNGDFAEMTDEEFTTEYNNGIIKILDNNIANIQYAEPVTITVNIVPMEDKVYTMKAEEFTKIDSVILKQQ